MKVQNLCRVCKKGQLHVVRESVVDYITGEKFSIHRCNNCFVKVTMPYPQSIENYYPKRYRNYNKYVQSILTWFYTLKINAWTRSFPHPGSVLEVGCGDGFMLGVLKKLGWDVVGLERNEAMAKNAAKNAGATVYSKGFEEISKSKKFDLIILYQVLEHVEDPLQVLKDCKERLSSHGKIIIGVPNFSSWQSLFSQEHWFHLDVPRHVSHFDIPSLKKLFDPLELSISHISHISFEHDPYGWVQSILNRVGFRQNNLTRILMGIDQLSFQEFFMIFIAILISPLALLLTIISWIYKKGAMLVLTIENQHLK